MIKKEQCKKRAHGPQYVRVGIQCFYRNFNQRVTVSQEERPTKSFESVIAMPYYPWRSL